MPTPTILILYAHPAAHQSRVNRRLAEAAQRLPNVTVHDLYQRYPDFYIDVAAEQAALAAADLVVFLHPIQWYSMPALMKEWVDLVLTAGWAYGKEGKALAGKAYLLAATTGSPEQAYCADGPHGRPLADYLHQFSQTAALCSMTWLEPQLLYGAHLVDNGAVDAHVAAFVARLAAFTSPLRTG